MKILKLEFENINNLKGKHCVDFTEKPLKDADIFAIIGVTGSGKSTLLDVITLALFNRTPRFDKISKNKILESGSIVTKNEKHATAKITFSVGKSIYKSVWNISSNRNNNLSDYYMELWEDGMLLDLKKSDVPEANKTIIGLDYEQFTKAIILSQGEFSKFLKADINERSALLEKITGTAIYRDLGKKVHEIHREKRMLKEQNEKILSAIILLSEQEIKDLERYKQNYTKQLEQQKKTEEQLAKNIKLKQDFLFVAKNLKTYQEQKINNTKKLSEFEPELKRLSLHHKILPFKKDIEGHTKISQLIDKTKTELKTYNDQLKKSEETKIILISELKKLIKEEDVLEVDFIEKSKAFEEKVKTLSNEISYITQDGVKLVNDIKMILNSQYLSDYQFDELKIEQVEQKLQEFKHLLETQNYSFESSLNHIEDDKHKIELTIEDYKALKNYKEQLKLLDKELKDIEKLKADFTNLLKGIPAKLKPLQQEEEILKLKLQKFEIEQKIASFEEQRKDLILGEPCPLCGALEHPYTQKALNNQLSITSLIDKTKRELDKLVKQISDTQTQETLLKSKIETQNTVILKNTENRKLLTERVEKQLHKSSLLEQVMDLDLDELLKKQEEHKTKLLLIISAFQKIEPLTNLKTKLLERDILRKQYAEKKAIKDKLYPKDDITDKMNVLQTKFSKVLSDMSLLKVNIKQSDTLLIGYEKEFKQLSNTIEDLKQKTDIQEFNLLKSNLLSDEVAQKIEQKKDNLEDEKKKIEAFLIETQKQFESFNLKEVQNLDLENLQKQEREIKQLNENYIGEIAKITQKLEVNQNEYKRKQNLITEFEKNKKDFSRWEILKSLIGDGEGKRFSAFAQQLTLNKLIAITNQRLEELSGRYLIFSEPKTQDLMIIDKYQGNSERSVKTLSGGETFLVSLALALSLSDMASKNVKLESLFIDEGFGALDEDTLENALNLLEKLQSENDKMVGVISHVKELKERISVQICLEKNSQGFSKIKIVE